MSRRRRIGSAIRRFDEQSNRALAFRHLDRQEFRLYEVSLDGDESSPGGILADLSV